MVQRHPFSVTSQPGHGGSLFRGSKSFLLAHPGHKGLRLSQNRSAPPHSANSFCSGAARFFYLSLSIVRPASPCRDDLPHALFSVGDPVASSDSTLSLSNGLNVFVRASLPGPPLDATALPLCPVCGITSGKSCFDCEQQFCVNHIYACADCGNQYCGACLDAHHADGHWADSDTAFELAASHRTGCSSSTSELAPAQGTVRSSSGHRTNSDTAASRGVPRPSSVNSPDLRHSAFAASHRVARSSSVDLRRSRLAASNHRQASWSAIPVKLKSLLSQRLTRLATLIGFMFQSVALPSEAGL